MKARVAVIDDDPDTVKVFSEFLKLKGVEVVGTGNNGKEAVDLYQELNPDVIILDMKMPEFDGNYAIDEIKKLHPDAKIIIVGTDYPDYDLKDEVTAIFYKPYDVDEIIDIINTKVISPN